MRALKAGKNYQSQRMFKHDLFEFFSRIPPWQPPAIFVPVILWSSYRSLALDTGWLFPLLFIAGVLHWTLMEYVIHRFAFHYDAKTPFGKRFIWLSHGVHHDWPNDKLRLVFPPAISVPLALIFWGLYTWWFGDVIRYGMFAGLTAGYLAYDMIHYFVHHYASKNPVFKWLRAYHLAHHFRHEPLRYGVSVPLWDYVFGTAPKSKVPATESEAHAR